MGTTPAGPLCCTASDGLIGAPQRAVIIRVHDRASCSSAGSRGCWLIITLKHGLLIIQVFSSLSSLGLYMLRMSRGVGGGV